MKQAGVIQLSAGSFHTCAVLNDSSLMCWGANGDGELGIENNWTDTAMPHVVDLGQGIRNLRSVELSALCNVC